MRVPFHQHEPGLAGLVLSRMKAMRGGDGLVVDRLHPLLRERPGVLDLL
jgi:hypothetical protein